MRHVLIAVVAALLMVPVGGVARAEEGAKIEMGLKMWLNQWSVDASGAESLTSDSTMLLGPAIEVKFNNPFFAEASYLFSTADYRFSDTGLKSDLQDLNLALGYMVIPGFGLVAGYKNSSRQNKVLGGKSTLDGPFLGVAGTAQADESLSVYGKINYLFTRFKETASSSNVTLPAVVPPPPVGFREDSPGWTFEFGFKYVLTKAFAGVIGYRLETNKGIDTGVRDTFSGFTLSGLVTF